MAALELSMTKKDKADVARRGYHQWRNRKRTAKIYIAVLFAMCGGVCPICGCGMILSFDQQENERPNSATLDHTIPLVETMEHSKFGLEIMCKRCNSIKSDRVEAQ